MRKYLLATASIAGLAFAASMAQAASYIPVVPPTGSVSTTIFGINDSNIVAGSFNDSGGVEHGFYGPPDGSNYTVFDFGGDSTGTEPRGIANDGSITGIAKGGSGFTIGEEFFRSPDGTINVIRNPYRIFDGVVQGLNDKDFFVGDFIGMKGIRVGYEGKDRQYRRRFKLPIDGVTSTNPRQRNNHGWVTGGFNDSAGIQHGFILKGDRAETFEVLDYPDAGALYTVGEGINDKGQVSGLWADSSGNRHGYVLDTATNTWTLIDGGDGSTFQQVWGINSKGLVAVNTQQSTGYVSYIYCPLKQSECPKGGVEAKVHQIHVAGSTFRNYDRHGRTGRHLPPRTALKQLGNQP
jgi:hypothetical protein